MLCSLTDFKSPTQAAYQYPKSRCFKLSQFCQTWCMTLRLNHQVSQVGRPLIIASPEQADNCQAVVLACQAWLHLQDGWFRNYWACHTCTVLSKPAEAMRLPSGDHATAIT